ncbi:MAG: DUF1134 domain-containing protein [Rhodospirillales bacterium]|nr:DUF1134 domain-containing protein [Rhodospirillales bacterium]MBO6786958.1 DUF1134 domain-containing protein [Rhodospirillales bacterium]
MVRRLFQMIGLPPAGARAWLAGMTVAVFLCALPAHAQDEDKTFSAEEIKNAAEGFFGATTAGLAEVIEKIFSDLGRPTAYIAGEEVSGAFVVGLRYGKGDLNIKAGGTSKIFWQGPSVGFDVGGNASKTFVLVYGLNSKDAIYKRFPGVEGTFYFVAGLGVNYQGDGDIMLAPIRTGVGLRTGANIGYLHYNAEHSWLPF